MYVHTYGRRMLEETCNKCKYLCCDFMSICIWNRPFPMIEKQVPHVWERGIGVGGVQTSHYLFPTWKVLREWLLPQLRLTEPFISIPTMPPLSPFFLFLLLLPRDSSLPLLYLNLLSTDRESVRTNNAAPQVFCLWGLESETSAECETPENKNTKWGPHHKILFYCLCLFASHRFFPRTWLICVDHPERFIQLCTWSSITEALWMLRSDGFFLVTTLLQALTPLWSFLPLFSSSLPLCFTLSNSLIS